MFYKLQKLFDSAPEKEFKARKQGLRTKIEAPPESSPEEQTDSFQYTYPGEEYKSNGRSTLIGKDPFENKLDGGREERIQSKLELIQKLQKELGIDE